MNTRKRNPARPEFGEEFLQAVIEANSPLAGEAAKQLAGAILAEMRRVLGRQGGRTTKAKYGPEHYSKIGKLGGRPKMRTVEA